MNKNFASLGLSAIMSASTIALTTALTLAATTGVAHAQVTSSSINGMVVDSNGNGIADASVSLVNTATGFARTVSTDSGGSFTGRNLPITGLYSITVRAPGFQGEVVEGVALSLSDDTQLSFQLDGLSGGGDTVVAVAQRQVVTNLALGPNASFGLETLENAPSINRNIADVIRIDPRVFVDEGRGGINSVQCVGQSSRFNSITLDGIALNDSFGLNSNGYPTERQPFPYDALEQVSVEIAPFDVKYGGFTACNINSVTKSGTNEFHGSAFVDYTNDSLRGKNVKDVDFDFGNFDEFRYGVGIGGPIIKDKLFFYASYEGLDGANTYPQTAITVGDGDFQINQAQIDEIAQISRDVYQYDPGFIPDSFGNKDDKILVRLDWNISDAHRASGTVNWNDGFNIVRSDGDTDELEFSNHLYERGTELFSYSGSLFSDWSDNFSTEFRANYIDVDNRQESIGGNDFGEFRVTVDSPTGRGDVDVYLGGDDSRQSNDLNYTVLQLFGRASYSMGDHSFTFGGEYSELDIFNLFVQHTETEIRFNSVDDFRNGIASQIEYNNSPTQNPDDAAANWGYSLNTLYAQDEWAVSDALTVILGARYDWYSSDDKPTENPAFTADYGFSNAQNFDGESLFQPRLGFTYDATDTLQIRGGAGRYSGGNPNVWLSNNYSSNNITQVGARLRDRAGIDLFALDYTAAEDGVPNGPGYAIPTELFDSVGTGVGRNFEINYLDPDFKIPSDWKYSLGATFTPDFDTGESLFGGQWLFQADLLWSDSENTAIIQRGDLVETGSRTVQVEEDGTVYDVTVPTFSSDLIDSFTLTNADKSNSAFVASIGASKRWDSGWSMRAGYAYSDAKDVQPMTSSVAFSNYNNRAYLNPQEQILSTSNYNTKHRFTASVANKSDWIIKDYDTNISAFFQSQSGQPFSRTLNGVANNLYRFTPFLGNSGDSILLPGTERNEYTSPSWTKIDLRISQELPGLRAEDRSEVFMVIDNLTNLVNSDWGVLERPAFPNTLNQGQRFGINQASAYEIRFGARYDF